MTKSTQGVLLVNLGSPDSYKPADVKVYLREFLMDKRVIDAPELIRKMIVEWFILPFRPKESGEAYESIWWEEGSPLIVLTQRVLDKLKKRMGNEYPMAIGMRYGNPSIKAGIESLMQQQPDLESVFLIPMYPQYAMATFETVVEKTKEDIAEHFPHLQLEVQEPFFDNPAYIRALGETMRPFLEQPFDHLLFSYHGVPERHLKKTDPTGRHCLKCENCCETPSEAHKVCYRHQDLKTTDLVMDYLKLPAEKWSVSFQSRLGIDPWLKPFTDKELIRLGKEGKKRVAIACPAFVSDCIETLEEIGIRGAEDFKEAGGEELVLIPCLNDHDLWVDVLESFVRSRADKRKEVHA